MMKKRMAYKRRASILKLTTSIFFIINISKSIIDSAKILQEQKKLATGIKMKASSLSEFISDNKEVTLKNFLINLLEGEKNQLSDKESNVKCALAFAEKKLEVDHEEFEKFTDEEKNQQKKKDIVRVSFKLN